jgi:hypothetical protein
MESWAVVMVAGRRGVLRSSRIDVGVGFVGAPTGEQFDWRLCAEIGTAAGTILLAM